MNIKPNAIFSRGRGGNLSSSGGKKALRASSLSTEKNLKIGVNNVFSYFPLETTRTSYHRSIKGFFIDEYVKGEVIAECLTPEKVLKENSTLLTEYEKKEILNYPEVYYISNSTKKHNGKFCDEKGYYRAFVGDQISYRYEISHLLGDGSFGIVVSCFDHKTQNPVAIKILRKGKNFEEIGEHEVKALDSIERDGFNDTIIDKLDQFRFRGHFCIVFELLSIDLFSYLKKNQFQGMNVNVLRRIAVQMLIGLKHIHKSGLIHCDLKPENILFKAMNKSSIKIIDFGSACEQSNKLFTYIQSRYYRAPEVMLDMDYNEKIDIWSLGCILFEMYTGTPLFVGRDEYEQLCRIVEVMGEFPSKMVRMSARRNELFDNEGKLVCVDEYMAEGGSKRLSSIIKSCDRGFIDFLSECLKLDPKQRIDAEQALSHPWIKGDKMKNSRSLRIYNKSSPIY